MESQERGLATLECRVIAPGSPFPCLAPACFAAGRHCSLQETAVLSHHGAFSILACLTLEWECAIQLKGWSVLCERLWPQGFLLIVMLQASLRLTDYNLNSEGLVSDKFGYLLMGKHKARLRLLAGASSVSWSDVQRSLKSLYFKWYTSSFPFLGILCLMQMTSNHPVTVSNHGKFLSVSIIWQKFL